METIEDSISINISDVANTLEDTYTICSAGASSGTDVTLKYVLPQCEYMYGCACTAIGMLLGYYDLYGYMGYDVSDVIPGTVSVLSRGTDGNKYNMNAFDTTLGNFVATESYVKRFYKQTKETELPYTYIDSSPQNGLNTPVFDCIADWIGTGQYWRGSADLNTMYTISNLKALQENTYTYSIETLQVPYQYLDIKWGLNEYLKTVGYSLNSIYTETVLADTQSGGTFTFEKYKAEIDAGRPVLISICTKNNEGHMVIGYGYNDETQEIIFDDLYNTDCRMTWTGSYTYGGKKYYMNAITTMIFNVAGLKKLPEGTAESYCITVDSELTGIYTLAQNSVSPEKTITIRDTDGTEIGVATLETTAVSESREYRLSLDSTKNVYLLTITEHDGVSPVVTVSAEPDNDAWTNGDVLVSATFTDNVGVVKQQYKIGDAAEWTDYTSTITVTENTTVYFQAKDAAGNVGTNQYTVTNIDKIAPAVNAAYNPTTWTYEPYAEVSAVASDSESGIKSVLYSLDGQEWLLYEDILTIYNNGIVYFKAEDNAGNVTETSVEVDCLTENVEKSTLTISENTEYMKNLAGLKTLNVKKGVSFSGYSLKTINGNATISISDNGSIDVKSVFSGETKGKISIFMKKRAMFNVYGDVDDVTKISSGADSSVTIDGKLTGTTSKDTLSFGKSSVNKLGGIVLLDGKNSITFDSLSNTEITGDINGACTLSIKKGTAAKTSKGVVTPAQYTHFSVASLTGTEYNDTFDFQDYTDVCITGGIDLNSGGNDTIKIGKNSVFEVKNILFSAVNSKNAFSVGTSSEAKINGNIENVRNLTLSSGTTAQDTVLNAEKVTGSVWSDTISIGSNCNVHISNGICLNDGGNDTVKVGKNSSFEVGSVLFCGENSKNTFSVGTSSTATINGNIENVRTLTLSNGTTTQNTFLNAIGVIGSVFDDTMSVGSNCKVCLSGNMELGEGKDSIKIGKSSSFEANNIDFGSGKNTLSIGSYSTVNVGNVSSLYSLTISSGKAPVKKKSETIPAVYTVFTCKSIIGTVENDTFTIGNYVKATVGDIDFNGGTKNKLKIGQNSVLEICGAINDLNSANIGKNSSVAASDATIEKIKTAGGKSGISKYATFISIGETDSIAETFKGIDSETADNSLDNIATESDEFTGWLSSEDPDGLSNFYNDDVDYFNLSDISAGNLERVSIHCEDGSALKVTVFRKDESGNWDDGTVVEVSGTTWNLENITATEYAIAVSLSDDFKSNGGVMNYQVIVAIPS